MANFSNGFDPVVCLESIAAIQADAERLASGLSEAQFHAPSPSGGWSIGFCLEHLVLSAQTMLPSWDLVLDFAPERSRAALPPRYALWQRAFLKSVEPPYTFKTNARQSVTPTTRRPMEETMRRLSMMHRELARRIQQSAERGVSRVTVQSPLLAWIRYPMGFSFDLALAHERRHLWQAWEVRRSYKG